MRWASLIGGNVIRSQKATCLIEVISLENRCTRPPLPVGSLVSPAHLFVKSLDRLQFVEPEELGEETEILSLDDFRVIVRSSRFDTVDELPVESLACEDSVSGLVVNQISSLDRQERELLQESFPKLDFDKLIILAEGRKPSPPSQLSAAELFAPARTTAERSF